MFRLVKPDNAPITIQSTSIEEAAWLMVETYGKGHHYTLRNEDDAKRPR